MKYRVIILSLTTCYIDGDRTYEYVLTKNDNFIHTVRSVKKYSFAPLHSDYLYAIALLNEHEADNILENLAKEVFKTYEKAQFRVEFVDLGFEFCKSFVEDKKESIMKEIEESIMEATTTENQKVESKANRPVEVLKHKWIKSLYHVAGNQDIDRYWWHCDQCGIRPTSVKNIPGEDKPLETACPGPALYK